MTPSSSSGCRFCGTPIEHTVVDLGMSPLCESYLSATQIDQVEPFYPLHVFVCGKCFLVQLKEYVSAEHIFSDYAYFSSYSDSWLAHAKAYTEYMTERFGLGPKSLVVELASNDGYLLQYFVAKGIPSLGIEPAANVAKAAEEKGHAMVVASEATAANVTAMLNKRGSPDFRNGWSARAKVNGKIGRIHGLKMVRTPPRNASTNNTIRLPLSSDETLYL